jgi:hypothetical protein
MMDVGTIQQGFDRRHQYDIVGPNQFAHRMISFEAPP